MTSHRLWKVTHDMDIANLSRHGWDWRETDDGRVIVYDPDGEQRCGAKTRSTSDGAPCKKHPVNGRERCRTHGGTIPRGEKHHSFTHGRYTRDMPTQLAERVMSLLDDPELLSLRENLALLDTRLEELAGRIDPGTYGAGYEDLDKQYTVARQTLSRALHDDPAAIDKFVNQFETIGDAIRRGKQDYHVWSEIVSLNDRRRVMTKTIQDIRHRGENAVAADRLVTVLSRLAAAFERVNGIDDPRQRAAMFSGEIVSIMDLEATG